MTGIRLNALSPRDQRALSLGVLVIAGVFTATRGVPALREWSAMSVASAREVGAEARRAQRSVLGARALSDTMRARSERFVALAPMLLDGSSASTAGATLASIVSGAAAAANARLGSVQVRANTTAVDTAGRRSFTRVVVRASLTADIRGLSHLLLALERNLTLLSIDELLVTQPDPAADGTRPEALQIELVVAGLAHTTGGTKP
jgi:hypothetical protein